MKQKKPKTQAVTPHRKPKKPKRLLAPWDKRRTVQSSIPYETMYDDGICYLGNSHYSLTFAVQDTNYVNVPEALQVGILEKYCKFLMALDDHSQLQIHVLSKPLARSTVHLQLPVPEGATELQKQCITDYNDAIADRLTGSDAYIQEKYMTFTVVESDYWTVRSSAWKILRSHLPSKSRARCACFLLTLTLCSFPLLPAGYIPFLPLLPDVCASAPLPAKRLPTPAASLRQR